MKLEIKISQDIKDAMLNKDSIKLEVCRSIKSAILIAKSAKGNLELDQEKEIEIIQKILKQTKESEKIYREKSRIDLADHEKKQSDIISKYLPKQFSEIEIKELVLDVMDALNMNSKKDMGLIIQEVMKRAKGRTEGKIVARIVQQNLS